MSNSIELIGWASSITLGVTLLAQVYKQWKEKTANGVSSLFFVGQVSAQVGFIIYSYLLGNTVFLVTNSLLLLVSFCGLILTWLYKSEEKLQQS